ncbi:MAG: chemotaxis protein CheW, partial [Spirochaetaceae bacterium]|nr:chemotaxis protein CheW [Spirochaetaceae bacterium]
MKTKDLETVNAELQEKKEAVDNVNFKMVTFSLGGKDYGVDIMNVKEIAKADKYTFVPNAASFVRGVYNLRGEIIPIIDLRLFFHLPATRSENNLDNMLILHIEDRVYGTIVDKIDKVVGINNEQIQPPHPIFGDINIKYISGVVEKHGSLYIILDVIRIFSQSQQEKDAPRGQMPIEDSTYYPAPTQSAVEDRGFSDENLSFIKEQLGALKKFYSSSVNEDWIKERLVEWGKDHKGEEVQLKTQADAEKYLM